MQRYVAVLAVVLLASVLTGQGAAQQNDIFGGTRFLCFTPYTGSGVEETAPAKTLASDQHYDNEYYFQSMPADTCDPLPDVTLEDLMYELTDPVDPAIFIVQNGHGVEESGKCWVEVEAYRWDSTGVHSRNRQLQHYRSLGYEVRAKDVTFVTYAIAVSSSQIGLWYNPSCISACNAFVWTIVCQSEKLALNGYWAATSWVYYKNDAYPGDTEFGNYCAAMNGHVFDFQSRTYTAYRTVYNAYRYAKSPFSKTSALFGGNGGYVELSRYVADFSPQQNTHLPSLTEPVHGHLQFSGPMDQADPATVISGVLYWGGGSAYVENAEWMTESRIEFDIYPSVIGQCAVRTSMDARSPNTYVVLDGNTLPQIGWDLENGVGPNQDPFQISLVADVGDINAAASFEGAGAWQDADGPHVWWIATEQGTTGYELYLGSCRQTLLAAVPATGAGLPVRFYETVLATSAVPGDTVEVVETPDGSSSRPFIIAAAPPQNIAALRTTNDLVAQWPPWPDGNGTARVICEDGCNGGDARYTDLVFLSSDSAFFARLQPVQNWWWENRGKTSQNVLLADNAAQTARSACLAIIEAAIAGNAPSLPYFCFVGEVNEGYDPGRNKIGTFYLPDPDSTCFWGCVSDGMLVDADGDSLPDAPWSRVDVATTEELDLAVRTALDFYNERHVASPKAAILNGNFGPGRQPTVEPTLTLARVAVQIGQHGIPTVTLHDTSFAYTDYQGRWDAVSAVMTAGVTELVATGDESNRSKWPGYFIQKFYEPFCTALPGNTVVVVEMPGCGVGDVWRNNPDYYPSLTKIATVADSTKGRAVAVLGHMTGGLRYQHLALMEQYFDERFAYQPEDWCIQVPYLRAIQRVAGVDPTCRHFLKSAGSFGWPALLPDMMSATAAFDPAEQFHPRLDVAPNPFATTTTIRYSVPSVSWVALDAYNVLGQRVAEVVPRHVVPSGSYTAAWTRWGATGRVPSGVYFLRLTVNNRTALTQKVTLR